MKIEVFECWNDVCSDCKSGDEVIWTLTNERVMGKMVCVRETNAILHLTFIETQPMKGIGRKLIRNLEQYCDANNIKYVYLYPHTDAIGFFEKMGFQHMTYHCDANFKKYIQSLHDAEIMSRIMYMTIERTVNQNLMT